MSVIGIVVISVVMLCAVAGAVASVFDSEKGLGKEFLDGLHAIGYIFVPVAGIMASVPLRSQLVRTVAGPVYATMGADPAMAATTFIAVDMGGYQLARSLTEVNEIWIKKYLARPTDAVGKRLGLESAGAAGLLAAVANILAMFRLVRDMEPKDKVLNVAFAVCAAFLFGDHLAFTANFQPNLIPAVMLGKLGGGMAAFLLAYRLSVPKAMALEKQQFGTLVPPAPVPVDHPSGIILGGKSSAKADR